MDPLSNVLHLVARQAAEGGDGGNPDTCVTNNDYDGRMGLRIASIFVIWFGSTVGALFPVFAKQHRNLGIPDWTFFIAKFFGSGVIIATAFIHLLSPAEDALRNPCLTGPITSYDWVSGIVLMTIFVLFFVELMVMRYSTADGDGTSHGHSHSGHVVDHSKESDHSDPNVPSSHKAVSSPGRDDVEGLGGSHQIGRDHLGHARRHNSIEEANNPFSFEEYKAQLTAIFILEFGIIFHSVFIGLTLAVAGSEFVTLFIVLIFHQTFEGLGLGARLAVTPWPQGKRWTAYVLGAAYGVSTPLAIAIGLGVRNSYPPEGRTTLLVNGVFDSISAGILIYTGLVELMAHEFMFSPSLRNGPLKTLLLAFFWMCLGAGLMALLGYWA